MDFQKLQIFSWSSTVRPYKMPPTINKLRVEVTTNTSGKMQHFPLYDCTDIVWDKCYYNDKLIQGSLTTHSNICRGSSALLSSFFKASPEGLKIKIKGRGEVMGMCSPHGQLLLGE